MRSAWASACWRESLPRSTSLAVWRCVTSRAFSSPASTNRWSTSLSRTGTSADAITWAISPPMTPAPTTAALNTNMAGELALVAELALRCQLVREALQRALQRLPQLPPEPPQPRRRDALPGRRLDFERDPRLLHARLECDASHTRVHRVLPVERVAEPRLVACNPLDHPAPRARWRVPGERRAGQRPLV